MNPYLTTKQMQNSTNLIFSLIKKSPPQNFIRQSLGKLKNGRNLPPNQTNTIGSIISLLLQLGLLKIGAWEKEWTWWWCHADRKIFFQVLEFPTFKMTAFSNFSCMFINLNYLFQFQSSCSNLLYLRTFQNKLKSILFVSKSGLTFHCSNTLFWWS